MSVFAFVGQETAVERYLYQKRKQRWSGVEGGGQKLGQLTLKAEDLCEKHFE